MPSPATLVSLERAKKQIRVTHTEEDDDILDRIDEAEDIILRYLNGADDPTWDESTVPGAVKAAILRQFTHLWRHRGDGEKPMPVEEHGLAPGVAGILAGYRTPTLG